MEDAEFFKPKIDGVLEKMLVIFYLVLKIIRHSEDNIFLRHTFVIHGLKNYGNTKKRNKI